MPLGKVKIHNVSYAYPLSDNQVLSKLTFLIKDEIVAILAPTGAGKTTLLSIISGLITPDEGVIQIDNHTPKEAIQLKKIGLSFQDSTLIEWKNVRDNILLPTTIGKKLGMVSEHEQRAEELLALIGLSRFADYKCSALSGGMKQRVGLARALITNPDVLLFDEPFNKLDYITKSQLLVEFRQILERKNISSLIITHSIEDAIFIADRILVLSSTPCTLVYDIPINFDSRDTNLLYKSVFLNKIAEIRELLLAV